jgi:transcriptional regulator with GAF, ATPase, and Fis domain
LIDRALEQTGGNQLRAARILKLKHTTLNAKIKRLGIELGKQSEDDTNSFE